MSAWRSSPATTVARLLATGLLAAALLGGCSGSLSRRTSGGSANQSGGPASLARYRQGLAGAQARLAAAEARIPSSPSTPAALARSILLLAGAIGQLRGDLVGMAAESPVSVDHRRLVAVTERYQAQLFALAKLASAPDGPERVGPALVSDSAAMSSAFTAAVARIEHTLP